MTIARFKEQLKDVGAKAQEFRADLEKAKKNLHLKEDKLSKLFVKADHQFEVRATSAL